MCNPYSHLVLLRILLALLLCAGTMTSGGTESLLLAIKTYRDRARVLSPHITKPEAIMCHSVHVAVPKGEHI